MCTIEDKTYTEIGTPTDDIEKRKAAFERVEKICRPIPDIDEKKELEEYRREKYGL